MYVSFVIRAIATAAVLRTALQCDCNPLSLYLTDVWFRYGSLSKRLLMLLPNGGTYQPQQQQQHPFQNQCIWIIGASSGIGEELAYQLVSLIHSHRSNNQNQNNHKRHKLQQEQSPPQQKPKSSSYTFDT
jgi:hypothetical protein